MCVWVRERLYFMRFSLYPSRKLPFDFCLNPIYAPVTLLSDPHKYLHFTYLESKYPLPAFLYVLAELKMHLLPVANCEWKAFDIMRGLVQYTGACTSMLALLISAKRCGPIFTAL